MIGHTSINDLVDMSLTDEAVDGTKTLLKLVKFRSVAHATAPSFDVFFPRFRSRFIVVVRDKC
jgi:hypothetical protein